MSTNREKTRRKMTRHGISIKAVGDKTHVVLRRHRGGAEQIMLGVDTDAAAAEICRALGAVPHNATRNERVRIVSEILRTDLLANR